MVANGVARIYTEQEVPLLYEELLAQNSEWLNTDPKYIELVDRAYKIATWAHGKQLRKSGEPYIIHPILVAKYATKIYPGDIDILLSALLHDVVEDSDKKIDEIQNEFPERPEVGKIVDALTKFKNIANPDDSGQVNNFRKLISQTINENPRIILIKIADRLHNMQTLSYQAKDKQQKISNETLHFYVPIAERLGLYTIKTELEDLSFYFNNPTAYRAIQEQFDKYRDKLTTVHQEVCDRVRRVLTAAGMEFELQSREKTPYSTYKKIDNKHIPFEEIYDLIALRIIFVPRPDIPEKTQCWFIYMLLTEMYPALRERTRDWVTTPKVNGYEALHCTLIDKNGQWVEVQIRTQRMNIIAEGGKASHWKYKKEKNVDSNGQLNELGLNLAKLGESYEMSPSAFMAHLNTDLISKKITVYRRIPSMGDDSPKTSEEFTIPRESRVLDFAYLLDKNTGDQALGARINGILTSLDYKLLSGDEVEIITAPSQSPSRNWTNIVATPLARNLINQSIEKKEEQNIEQGKQRLLEIFNDLDEVYTEEVLTGLLDFFDEKDLNTFYTDLNEGLINPQILQRKLRSALRANSVSKFWTRLGNFISLSVLRQHKTCSTENAPTHIHNAPNIKLMTSPCCFALPGDKDVICFRDPATKENVIRVHKANCGEAQRLSLEFGNHLVRDVNWNEKTDTEYPTHIYVGGTDRTNLLVELFTAFEKMLPNTNITRADLRSENGNFQGVLSFSLQHLTQLEHLIQKLYKIDGVHRIYRLDVPSSYEFVDRL